MERKMEGIRDTRFEMQDFVVLMTCKIDIKLLTTPFNDKGILSGQ